MVFKRLLGSLGAGGPKVDTVLDPGAVAPGGVLGGQVHLEGGGADFTIEHITLELVARVEAERGDGESAGTAAFDRQVVGGPFRLAAGERRDVPFSITLPWEMPITELHGQQLGIALGVRTELGVAGARDKGDLDPLTVHPLPVQEAVLEAFGQLGFGFASTDLEAGRISGTGQRLPFYQEIELTPAPAYADRVNEIEVTFLANPAGVEVVLEADRRSGYPHEGGDALTRVTVDHADAIRTDWNARVESWLDRLADRRPPGASGSGYADHTAHGHHDEHGPGRRSGPGAGTAVAAGAAGLAVGVAGGLVAAEVVDEVGDFFEGDDEGGEAEEG